MGFVVRCTMILLDKEQIRDGLPVKPGGQEHTGTWLIGLQDACVPQALRQGFLHLLWTHARFEGQSLLFRHSYGRQ